ncbi:hypothetical protein COO60DRAFT_865502 [Scenedesmus sp. NREL 46B-D3]|nr:hypothetical protein COO60DRAFT_865502 [Scenedesmus sp. NREL 46B-D3]
MWQMHHGVNAGHGAQMRQLKLNLLVAAAVAATSCTFRLPCSSTSCMPAAHKQCCDLQTCLSAAAVCTFDLHCYDTICLLLSLCNSLPDCKQQSLRHTHHAVQSGRYTTEPDVLSSLC